MRDFNDILADFWYTSYCEHTGFKSAVTGADLPKWETVIEPVKNAWKHVAATVYQRRHDIEDQNL